MRFFVPQAKPSQFEAVYQTIAESIKDQLGWKIAERRILSLHYIHDKREYTVEVGKMDNQEHRYQILAIFESNAYVVFTRSLEGGPGTTILIDKTEVTGLVEFDRVTASK